MSGAFTPRAGTRPPTALTIAGSDPSGGAGIQADLKTFTAFGVYGTAVLTALTAQSTTGVTDVHVSPASFVRAQLDTLAADVQIDAVKIGMLADADVAHAVTDWLGEFRAAWPHVPVVLDPVMVSTSGHTLLADDAVLALREQVAPQADLLTPNLYESALLSGSAVADRVDQMIEQAKALQDLGIASVLVKGGHLLVDADSALGTGLDAAVDVLLDADGVQVLERERVLTPNTHGTGCTLSSAIAAAAASRVHAGATVEGRWVDQVERARDYLTAALQGGRAWRLGSGSGPVDHLVEHPWEPLRANRARHAVDMGV